MGPFLLLIFREPAAGSGGDCTLWNVRSHGKGYSLPILHPSLNPLSLGPSLMAENKSKNVCFALDPDTHALAVTKAAELGITVSALAKTLISRIATSTESEAQGEVETQHYERLKISLSLDEKEAIAQHAKTNAWSMSRECRFRIISSLSATPKLLPDELVSIRGLRSAVDAAGRTIHHMMRTNQLTVNDTAFMAEIATLMQCNTAIIKKLRTLETATVDRWQFNLRGMKSTYS